MGRIRDLVDEVHQFRQWATEVSEGELRSQLPYHFAIEWRWNVIADELNRRRRARRLAR
jgi:hypothetical protein